MKNNTNGVLKPITVILVATIMIASVLVVMGDRAETNPQTENPAIFEYNEKPFPIQEYDPGEIIVKFKSGVSDEVISKINSRHGTSVIYASPYAGFKRLKIPEGRAVYKMVKIYSENPNVEYAEPNFYAYALIVPNDEYYPYQWHMDGINVEPAWNISTGSGVTVAIVDTGIAYEDYRKYCQAPDLAQTCFVSGYDFANNDEHPNDDNGHGTHVAGTVAQSTNNSIGVAGVAFDTCLMPVKVLDRYGEGTYADVADGIRFAVDNGAKVISLSLGGSYPSTTLEEAVAYAYKNNVTMISAIGNDNESTALYPAAYDDYVIAVGATQYDETKAPYSNYGPSLDLVAPGGNNNLDQNNDSYADGVLQQTFDSSPVCDFDYYFFQGTSMATPHVSGVSALLIANGDANTPDEVRTTLQETAKDKGDTGRDDTYGWGIVDAYAALQWTAAPDITPPVISNVNATDITDLSVKITWDTDEPADSLVRYGTESGNYTDNVSDSAYVTSHAIDLTELAPETTYYYVVNSTDKSGNLAESFEYNFTTKEALPTPEMHVASIDMELVSRYQGWNYYVTATVTIVDNTGSSVEDATVYGNWSDATTDSDSGTTDASGKVTLQSDSVWKPESGTTFTFCVTDVEKTDWQYNSSANVETCNSTSVP